MSDKSYEALPTADLVESLKSTHRLERMAASHELRARAEKDASELVQYAQDMNRALSSVEAQTRWELLAALSAVAAVDIKAVARTFREAEASLFDDESSAVRLAAFRFFVVFGANNEKNSDKAWPLIDEFIQCYHGDPEYRDILTQLVCFAKGNLSQKTRKSFTDRLSFDAESAHGYIKTFSVEIIEILKRAQ